jgi:ParB-like chromosome segregation protein Spo0J
MHDKRELAVEYVSVETLKPDPRNPLGHSPQQIRQIAKSIEKFGFNAPVLLGLNNKIVAGHARVHACEHLGLTRVCSLKGSR